MKLPSASALDRSFACPASQALPRVRSSGPWAERGQGVHDFIVTAQLKGRDLALEELDPEASHYQLCVNLPLDQMPQGGRLEASFAWNWQTRTARFLGVNLDRQYDAYDILPEEFVGTTDLDGAVGDLAVVIDWKSGFKHLGPPEQSGQLRFGALAVAGVRGLDRARVSFWYLRDDGGFREDFAELNALDLADFADELEELVERIQRAREIVAAGKLPTVSEGPWCDYCPALASCPAKTALARAMVTEPQLLLERLGTLTPADAGIVYERIKAFEQIAKRIKDGIRSMATLEPIPLSGGKLLREVSWPNTVIKQEVAYKVIAEKYGPDVADQACPRDVTQASIERAVRSATVKQKKPTAPAVRELLREIEQAKGLVVISQPQVREGK